MTRLKLIATACITAVLLMVNVATAQDFNTNERTFLTFSAPVELPGITLQPGTYLFRLADSQSNRHIIQVLSQDEKQIHATILAIPAERLEVTGENVVTFKETAEGRTPAVQYWYYPGDKIGHEFLYPKDQAMRIAERTGVTVQSTDGAVSADSAASAAVSTEAERPAPTVAAAPEPEPAAAPAPMPSEQTEPQPVGTSGTGNAAASEAELPRTASPLPLSGLFGLFSLGGALGVRSLRRRQ
jgi:hypothetical protein